MNKKRVHTPEGVRDVYGIEYRRRSKLKDKLSMFSLVMVMKESGPRDLNF